MRRGPRDSQPLGTIISIIVVGVALFASASLMNQLTAEQSEAEAMSINETAFADASRTVADAMALTAEMILTVGGALIAISLLLGVAGGLRQIIAERTHYPTATVGRQRRVSRVREPVEECWHCGIQDAEGVVTAAHEETVLFGIVVYTHQTSRHEDCVECFAAQFPQTARIDVDGFDAPEVDV